MLIARWRHTDRDHNDVYWPVATEAETKHIYDKINEFNMIFCVNYNLTTEDVTTNNKTSIRILFLVLETVK